MMRRTILTILGAVVVVTASLSVGYLSGYAAGRCASRDVSRELAVESAKRLARDWAETNSAISVDERFVRVHSLGIVDERQRWIILVKASVGCGSFLDDSQFVLLASRHDDEPLRLDTVEPQWLDVLPCEFLDEIDMPVSR